MLVVLNIHARLREHHAPVGKGLRRPEAEEGEARGVEDRDPRVERREDEDRGDAVREDGAEEEARVKARQLVERQLAEIEAQGEIYAEQVAKLRADPEFRKRAGLDQK